MSSAECSAAVGVLFCRQSTSIGTATLSSGSRYLRAAKCRTCSQTFCCEQFTKGQASCADLLFDVLWHMHQAYFITEPPCEGQQSCCVEFLRKQGHLLKSAVTDGWRSAVFFCVSVMCLSPYVLKPYKHDAGRACRVCAGDGFPCCLHGRICEHRICTVWL